MRATGGIVSIPRVLEKQMQGIVKYMYVHGTATIRQKQFHEAWICPVDPIREEHGGVGKKEEE
jgi:hypothetical protein